MKSFGLYIHIPYCVKKCNYCDFASVGIGDCSQKTDEITGEIDCLIDAEITELKKYADKLKEKDIEVLTNKDIGGIIKWVHILK